MTGREDGQLENRTVRHGGSPRSGRSMIGSYVRFVNNTQRHVDIVWLNYEGARVRYKTLQPQQFVDVNTFVGHPWIFRDAETGDHLVVQLREIFQASNENNARNGPPRRRIVNITIPMYSLKMRSLQVLRCLVNKNRLSELDLPKSLEAELQEMIDRKWRRDMQPHSPAAGPSTEEISN